MVSHRIKVAYPVMLVLGGIALSFVPGMPRLRIHPDVIFLVFLPPILYEAAVANSWKELWRWRRIIGSFAFIVVLLRLWLWDILPTLSFRASLWPWAF